MTLDCEGNKTECALVLLTVNAIIITILETPYASQLSLHHASEVGISAPI